jgi:hypothetical protein
VTATVRAEGYEENHSAVTWPLLGWFAIVPLAAEAAAAWAAFTLTQAAAGLMGVVLVAVMAGFSMIYRNWPTGVRIDQSGITVGAVKTPQRDLKWRHPTVWHQAHGVYTCPWDSVHEVRVVTDRTELRRLARSPAYYTFTNRWGGKPAIAHINIGVLAAPFMRAALVAEIYPSGVEATGVRPGRAYSSRYGSRKIPPRMSDTWIVPTRHPEALQEALRLYQLRNPPPRFRRTGRQAGKPVQG